MTNEKHRAQRQQFSSRVRFVVPGKDAIAERFASNLSEGGLFVRDDEPPIVGSLVLIEFILPDGRPLSRVAAKVRHSRPATAPGDLNAGMGLEFVKLDETARTIAERLDSADTKVISDSVEEEQAQPRLLDLKGLEAPLISASGPIVGIDLGTVNSCVALVQNDKPQVLLSPQGYDTVPSVVFLTKEEDLLVGHKALERMILSPDRAVYGSKRFLGRPFRSKEIQAFGHFFNYQLVESSDGRAAASVVGHTLRLEEVAGQVLLMLRKMAEHRLGTPVARAVVTVPSYFGETQRQAVRDAGRLAGLNVERILNEPTAAAVAYGYGRGMRKTVLVYDLGGGTFDATVLRINGDTFEVLSTGGDPFLGGQDFDDRLTEYVLSSFERSGGTPLRFDPVAVQRIRFAVELAKRQLSEASSAELDLPYVAQTEEGPVHLRMQLERELLERITQDLIDRTLGIVQEVLDQAQVGTGDLDDVLLVGGQSRSPHVRRVLSQRFNRTPSAAVHPTEAVALGAAVLAEALHSDLAVQLNDILPASLRVAMPEGGTQLLLPRGSRLPVQTEFAVPHGPGEPAEIRVALYRGEEEIAEQNTFLGALIFPPPTSAEEATAAAKVLLKVSNDGLLSVVAFHPVTGESKEMDLLLTDE